jgi:hypothetical protein
LTNTGNYSIRTDAPITYTGRLEISWDEPEPKHKCKESLDQEGEVVYGPAKWSICGKDDWYFKEPRGGWYLKETGVGNDRGLKILRCPYCGEKLE